MILYIIGGLIGLVILWLIVVYNGLVGLRNRTQEAWSDIAVQLKRRYDLIPNLVTMVKGYARHEAKVFTEVTRARTEAMGAQGAGAKAEAENMLTQALKTIFAVAENYPQLRASENFQSLQGELAETENKISASRRYYNSNVRDFNTKIQVFPNSLVANSLGFKEFELFELAESQKQAASEPPKVDFE